MASPSSPRRGSIRSRPVEPPSASAAPRALLPAFANARHLIDRQPPSLYQTVVAEFMREGHFAAHIRRMRQLYREQRDALAETLARRAAGHLRIEVPDQGMHLVAYLEN